MRARWPGIKKWVQYPDAMPNMEPETIRLLKDGELYHLLADHTPQSAPHIAGQAELRRRENRTARLALWISFASLLVSLAGAWRPWSGR